MNRKYWMIWAACLLLPLGINAQTFASMWKQVEAAQDKDLPQTALIQVRKIEAKATKENAYGQLSRDGPTGGLCSHTGKDLPQ